MRPKLASTVTAISTVVVAPQSSFTTTLNGIPVSSPVFRGGFFGASASSRSSSWKATPKNGTRFVLGPDTTMGPLLAKRSKLFTKVNFPAADGVAAAAIVKLSQSRAIFSLPARMIEK